ncbi:tRNA (adenosine(37)-N6)-threonylcarbamoyltransferase complex ATPase subunit type 1 TsaE [Methylococcus sp. EFPC2]|uniref:tRNA (adenosine(37)-N6)-threonylcarbamoyltransferase complex ATPase subunit type 1 TsaE n=1 Tax=Methylococcus sp. EFPC2 TaxID=2812648 RepID=UPI001967A0AF|nr:tRNA (adenosine(37)-N6)-threonylcarbamoyltransferase complex ATPase subunit type 1 TsaE [Methylococcus sp. EFPC2]QSA98553.1 tRNA (adenosine(37)-N6)-threonylcarbamoyltransferase complex ATPase subunit type 1 TsaE [Methylococcus sp. EFPC2]
MKRFLPDEAATATLAARFQAFLSAGLVVFLHGPLGAGKTAFVRGVLRAAGYAGAVKSPTYTLVEEYRLNDGDYTIFHFDLYRLTDPEELEFMGIRDYFGPRSVCFIEWPERGAGVLPPADLDLTLAMQGPGRELRMTASTPAGRVLLQSIDK